MCDYRYLIYEIVENIAWITLNRVESYNALNSALRSELVNALDTSRDDNNVNVIVITGAGEKAFCAGADIHEISNLSTADYINRNYGHFNSVSYAREIPKPVIAMVNGVAVGGGCELVMACDIAIASETAQFGQPEIRVGLIPGAGGTQILPRLVGEKKAKELVFTGNLISAVTALQIGIVNSVVPLSELKNTTRELANKIAHQSPLILKLAKAAINRSMETTLSAGLALERDLFITCFGTLDQKEGARAFAEKRPPKYTGK